MSADCFVMISGCSGGGKSTLIEELARRGHTVVREPGRRIIADVRAGRGGALPWDAGRVRAPCPDDVDR